MVKPNLERECESHDDIRNHNILQVDNEVRLRGDAKKHPHSYGIKWQPHQKEKGVENWKNHRLQNIVTGTSAVGVAMIAGEQGESCISLHEGLKYTRESSSQYSVKFAQQTNKQEKIPTLNLKDKTYTLLELLFHEKGSHSYDYI